MGVQNIRRYSHAPIPCRPGTLARKADHGNVPSRGPASRLSYHRFVVAASQPVIDERRISFQVGYQSHGLLWRECRTLVPDCTVDEVLQFSSLKAAGIWADKNIRNTIALLLSSVSESFNSNSVYRLRQQKLKHHL